MRILLALIIFGNILAINMISAADRSENLRDLVNSEREFAQRARADGMQKAFLSTLSDNAVVFRPLPVNGKLWYWERGKTEAQLIWEPEFADVSFAGDLGFTTGPWEYLPRGEGSEQSFFGHYLSVWRRTLDGGWMVVIDISINHEGPFEPAELITATVNGKKYDADEAWQQIADAESSLGEPSEEELRDHYAGLFDNDVRFYRDGKAPILGKDAALEALGESPSEIRVSTLEIVVSNSGDLAYAYGTQEFVAESESPKRESYLRIWRNQGNGEWLIVVDIALPSQ